jgi:hypothetical protein
MDDLRWRIDLVADVLATERELLAKVRNEIASRSSAKQLKGIDDMLEKNCVHLERMLAELKALA